MLMLMLQFGWFEPYLVDPFVQDSLFVQAVQVDLSLQVHLALLLFRLDPQYQL